MGFFTQKLHVEEMLLGNTYQILGFIECKGRRSTASSSKSNEHITMLYELLKQENVRVYKSHSHTESKDDRYDQNGDLFFQYASQVLKLKSKDFIYKGNKITLRLTFEGLNRASDLDYVSSLFDAHQIKYYTNNEESLQIRYYETDNEAVKRQISQIIIHDVIDVIKAINIIKTFAVKDTPSDIDLLNKNILELEKDSEYRRTRLNRSKECIELIVQAYLQGISKFSKPPIELVKEYVEAELQSTLTEAELQDINLLLDKLVNLHLSLKNSLYLGKLCHSDHSLFNRLPPEVLEQVGGFYLQGQNPSSISTGSDLRKNAGTLFELGIRKDKGKEKILLKESATDPDELSDSEDELETCDVQAC